jgi:hypothetical protein
MLIPAAVCGAQGIQYAPGTSRYEATNIASTTQGIFATAGALDLQSRVLCTVSFAQSGRDSLIMEILVDSSSSSMSGTNRSIGQLVRPGTRIQRRMSVLGRSRGSDGEVRSAAQLVTAVFPSLAPGAILGSAWEDTLPLTNVSVAGVLDNLAGRIVRSSVVSRDTTFEGEPAWKIVTGSTIEVSGAASDRMPISIDGTGSGAGVIFFSKKGVLMHSKETQTITFNLRTSEGSMGIPIETNVTSTVNRIR